MLSTYQYPQFSYQPPAAVRSGQVQRHPVIVVGAGPVGLAAAIDLAQQGIAVLLLDDDNTVSVGSRGVCYAKRALEVLDRIGCGEPACAKGVSWNVGRNFFRNDEVYNFNLLPQPGYKRPGMINLQQYYLEEYLVKRAEQLGVELRWKNQVIAVTPQDNGALLEVNTPDGQYRLEADWLIVADGARSPIRRMLGLEIEGKVFMDRFLIADVVMKADYPAERWFWFDPPFHPNQSVLLHKQADNVWRIDFQLGWDADPELEKRPERVIPRIQAMLGDEREFELEWVSVYTFQCRRMQSFSHGQVLFVGDAAHQVSPFGARGANSGLQDTDNLAWKLKLVLDGLAPASLLDSYSAERTYAADENILNSTRSTDFITPKSNTSKTFRNAVLMLAEQLPFARALVNSGRLSVAAHYINSRLNTPDEAEFSSYMLPGSPPEDAPLRLNDQDTWLTEQTGNRFQLLYFCHDASTLTDALQQELAALSDSEIPIQPLLISQQPSTLAGFTVLHDVQGLAAMRYDGQPDSCYLLRPDQHVAGRWRQLHSAKVRAALARATGH